MPQNSNADKTHSEAAEIYGDHAQQHTTDQRELEARVLLKSARHLQEMKDNWSEVTTEILADNLKYNRNIWMLFYDTALENPEGNRPDDLRSNIINLANFTFKRELEILADPSPDKLDVLITINKEISAGLMTKPQTEGEETTNEQQPSPQSDEQEQMPPSSQSGGSTSTTA